jgi:hypothetical protein
MSAREAQDFIKSRSTYAMGFTEGEVFGMLRSIGYDFSEFERWIRGSACPIAPDGTELYFHHDVFRFMIMVANGTRKVGDFEENAHEGALKSIVRQIKIDMIQ